MPDLRPRILLVRRDNGNGYEVLFHLVESSAVMTELYDVAGRVVRSWAVENFPAGTHRLTWDGRNQHGDEVPSGIYLLRLRCAGRQAVRKLLVVR